MPNNNCLSGLQCPQCKSPEPLAIEITPRMRVLDPDIKRLAEKAGDTEGNEKALLNLISGRARKALQGRRHSVNGPTELSNFDRAEQAEKALTAYSPGNDPPTNAVDFLADLQHFYNIEHAYTFGHPTFNEALGTARGHFEAELVEAV